jgi:hypothetical protein
MPDRTGVAQRCANALRYWRTLLARAAGGSARPWAQPDWTNPAQPWTFRRVTQVPLSELGQVG